MNRKTFRYRLPLYVAVTILSVVSWYFAFNLYHAPKDVETVKLFFAGRVEDYSFAELSANECRADGVNFVEISSCHPSDGVFATKYGLVGMSCDVLLVPLSVANTTKCEGAFKQLAQGAFGETFEQEGKRYGLFLPEQAQADLAKFFAFSDERYVLFVSATSPNGGEGCATDIAVKYVEWMVNYREI